MPLAPRIPIELTMSRYHLRVDLGPKGPVRSLSISLSSRDEAFIVAQRYKRPSQLWNEDGKLCSLACGEGGLWIISN